MFLSDFTNSEIILHDKETQKVLFKAKILDYDKTLKRVYIDLNISDLMDKTHFFVLIFKNGTIYSFDANVIDNKLSNIVQLGLYNEKKRELRCAKRFALNAMAVVNKLKILPDDIKLEKKILVSVVNISQRGILIRAADGLFDIDETVLVKFKINNETISTAATIVRITQHNDKYSNYGCKLIANL